MNHSSLDIKIEVHFLTCLTVMHDWQAQIAQKTSLAVVGNNDKNYKSRDSHARASNIFENNDLRIPYQNTRPTI